MKYPGKLFFILIIGQSSNSLEMLKWIRRKVKAGGLALKVITVSQFVPILYKLSWQQTWHMASMDAKEEWPREQVVRS